MAAQKSKISLIAICMDPSRHMAEPQALVIGSRGEWTQDMPDGTVRHWGEGEDWRYACYPLTELKRRLTSADEELLDDRFGASGEINALLLAVNTRKNGALSQAELDGLDDGVFTSNYLKQTLALKNSPLSPATSRRQTALVARNVERISWFSHDRGERAMAPFSVLDTANPAEPAAPPSAPRKHPFGANIAGGNEKLGSRLILFPDLSDPARPGALTAVSINLQIKVAVNGHHIADADEHRFDRHDTRMLFELSVAGGGWTPGARKNMWFELARRVRGMQFDAMHLWCTMAPFDGTLKARSERQSLARCDVLAYANIEAQIVGDENGGNGAPFYVPALARLGIAEEHLVTAGITRWFGFRKLDVDPATAGDIVRKIGWRFETVVQPGRLAEAIFLAPAATALFPFESKKVLDALLHQEIMIAEEQRLAAIADPTLLAGVARTILTIRLGGEKQLQKIDERVSAMVLSTLQAAIGSVHGGLRSVRDGAPLSLLPRLANKKLSLAWHLVGSVADASPGHRALWNQATKSMTGAALDVRLAVFEPCQQLDMWSPSKTPVAARTVAALPRLVNVARRFPAFDVELSAARLSQPTDVNEAPCVEWPACQSVASAAGPGELIPGTRLAMKALGLAQVKNSEGKLAPDTQRTILQAFQFRFAAINDGALGKPLVSDILLTPLEKEADPVEHDYPFSLSAWIRLPLAEVEPAAEDDIRAMARDTERKYPRLSDRRLPDPDTPLLFRMESGDEEARPVHLSLTAHEQVGRDFTHTVALSLAAVGEEGEQGAASDTAGPQRRRALIIEPSPFRIAAVDYQAISSLGSPQNSEVAVWNESGEGGESWRVRDDRQIVDIILPPQALGEAMEKNRSDLPGMPRDIEPGKPAAARFGSLTVLKVDPTWADTAFREPGWNLRRILGYAAQRSPGSRVVDLRLEMLYGLLANVKSDNVNITEIAGAIGEPPAALLDVMAEPHMHRHLALMRAVFQAEQRRLAVEKLWQHKPDEDLRLSEGVSYRLRRNEPGTAGGPATPLRWPVPGPVPAESAQFIDNRILQATFSTSPDDGQSFPGGLAWAFESANLLMEVYGKPVADEGSVRGLCLTALGGFGAQRALFAHKKSIVESETTLGRVQRYRLERIGRISSLWHRAKHVIVYERTVVPPAQFYNKPPIGLRQDEHLGRAIARKVEEYVEILTPLRSYPEDGTSIRDNGFILGAEFKSIKIRVDSAWGHDVRREGWEVPLWNTAFLGLAKSDDPDDPSNLYPMPQICLRLAGKDGKPVPIEVADPEKLHFYTSALDSEDDNTDAWKAVRDVDFCDFPLPQLGKTEPHSADLSDAMLPSAPAVIPGYERFTLSLVPSNDLVAITHGRIDDGPLTALRNVTISRAAGVAIGSATPVQELGAELAAKAANVRAEIDRRVGRVLAGLDQLDTRNAGTLVEQAKARIEEALGGLAPDKLAGAIKGTRDQLSTLSSKGWPQLGGLCDGIKAKVSAQIDGQFNRLMIVAADMARAAVRDAGKGIDEAAGLASAHVEKVNLLAASAARALAELEAAAQSADGKARQEARAAAHRLAGEAKAALDQLQRSAGAEISQAADSAIAQVATLRPRLAAEVFSLRAAASADLGAVVKLVDGGVSKSTLDLKTLMSDGVAQIQSLMDAVAASAGKLTQQVRTAAQRCLDTIAKLRRDLDNEVAKIERGGAPPEARRLCQVVDMALAAAAQACAAINKGADDTAVELAPITLARGQLTAAQGAINGKLDTVAGSIAALSAQLESMLDQAYALVAGPRGLLETVLPDDPVIDGAKAALAAAKSALLGVVASLDAVETRADALLAQIDIHSQAPIAPALAAAAQQLAASARGLVEGVQAALKDVHGVAAAARTQLEQKLADLLASLKQAVLALREAILPARDKLLDEVAAQCQVVEGFAKSLLGQAQGELAATIDQLIGESIGIEQYGKELQEQIELALATADESIKDIKAAAEQAAAKFTSQAEQSARQLVGSLQESLRDMTGGADLQDIARRAEGVYQKGDGAFRALAALGDPPKSNNGIDYNRTEVQFVMNAANKLGIDMTPTVALVNRAADQIAAVEHAGKAVGDLLDSFGVRLPLSSIGESLIPDSLKGLSVADMLPDIAGIDMEGLLKEVGFPDLDDSKAIKIRHSVDQASMQVCMEADLDIPFGASAVPLMSFGPVQILIDAARLTASSRIGAGIGGGKASMSGKIFGDWRIVCSGQTILTFRKTGLYFDDSGKIDFRIQPERVELADALKFITDLMGATGQKGGMRIEPFVRGGVPSGVAATLDMVLPPIQTGAFGISDLSLHLMFGLAAVPEFEIVSEMSIGMRTAPFTLNVWILNGGGYLMQRLSYLPTAHPTALMNYTLEVGVVVGLGLGFSFGVVSGGVWVQVGCSLAFTWSNGGSSTTAIRVFLLVRGNVDVCGLITASITLLFEVTYDGASIIGAGTLTVRAKISMFYTLEVDQHVEYVFTGEKKQVGNEDYAAAYC